MHRHHVKGEELEDGENSCIIQDMCSLSNMGHDVIDRSFITLGSCPQVQALHRFHQEPCQI